MSLIASEEHVVYCFDVLHAHFNNKPKPAITFNTTTKAPMFITLHKDNNLRGCIGTLSPCSLTKMADYVHSSAFKDRRFNPVEAEELQSLDVSVSLLVEYENGKDCYDWIIGKHGIIIEFHDDDGNNYNATYLPEVASEQHWSQTQAIESLIRKSGYKSNTITTELLESIVLTRYQSSKYNMHYSQYIRMKG